MRIGVMEVKIYAVYGEYYSASRFGRFATRKKGEGTRCVASINVEGMIVHKRSSGKNLRRLLCFFRLLITPIFDLVISFTSICSD
jgi:hypothetical protein